MSPASQRSCVVFGAGALGLGFLGPELAPHCRLTYIDVPAKADFIRHLRKGHGYVSNETGPSVRAVEVSGVDGLFKEPGTVTDEALAALAGAELVLTVVGESHLVELGPVLAAAASERTAERPLRVLCGENGVGIAARLRGIIEKTAGRALGGRLLTGDTVMARTCRTLEAPEPPLAPVAPDFGWGLVADRFFGIPVECATVAGLEDLPPAISPQPADRFKALEDAKLIVHNGLHALLACLGHLKGVKLLSDVPRDAGLMALGRRLLLEEAAPALLKKHGPALDRIECLGYCDWVLRRVTCPVFRDPIERGVRGIMRKLEPRERLVYSVRTVWEQGIEPTAFAAAIAAAVGIARRTGETDLGFREVLTTHCGFDAESDADLLALIEARAL